MKKLQKSRCSPPPSLVNVSLFPLNRIKKCPRELTIAAACRQRKCKCNRVLPVCGSCASDPSKCWYSQGSKRGIPAGYINSLETRLAETESALYYALCELHSGYREQGSYGPLAEHLKQRYGHGKTDVTKDWKDLPMTNRQQAQAWWLERELEISSRQSTSHHRGRGGQAASYPSGLPSGSGMVPVVQVPHGSMTSWQQESFPASEIQFQSQFQQLSTSPAPQYGQQGGIQGYQQSPTMASPTDMRDVHAAHYQAHSRQPSNVDPATGQPSTSTAEQLSGKARALAEDQSNRYF